MRELDRVGPAVPPASDILVQVLLGALLVAAFMGTAWLMFGVR
jgi:hypothetical protein